MSFNRSDSDDIFIDLLNYLERLGSSSEITEKVYLGLYDRITNLYDSFAEVE